MNLNINKKPLPPYAILYLLSLTSNSLFILSFDSNSCSQLASCRCNKNKSLSGSQEHMYVHIP